MNYCVFVRSVADQLGVGHAELSLEEARTRVRRHLRAAIGGLARARRLTAEQRAASSSLAAKGRWSRVLPEERREQMAVLSSLRRAGDRFP